MGRSLDWYDDFPEKYENLTATGSSGPVNVFEYSNTAYLRTHWSLMEETEGDYFWLHEDHPYMKMINYCLERGMQIAFRIVVDSYQQSQATPLYVFEEPYNAEYRIVNGSGDDGDKSPYPDSEGFQKAYEKFLRAFAKEFNDSDKVAFIDGYGLGAWGEGHSVVYKDEDANKLPVFEWITDLYTECFTEVPLVITYHRHLGTSNLGGGLNTDSEEMIRTAVEKGYSLRNDAFGMKNSDWGYTSWERNIAATYRYIRPIIMEGGYVVDNAGHQSGMAGDGYTTHAEVRRGEYEDSAESRVNMMDFRTNGEIDSWFGDAPELVQQFIEEGGYRLYPAQVSAPAAMTNGGTVTVQHRWSNLGWGYCPNNIPQWNHKYKAAFALLDGDGNVVAEFVDYAADPAEWTNSGATTYTFEFIPDGIPSGSYSLAIGIVDTSKEGDIKPVGIQIAVQESSRIGDGWAKVMDVTVN